MPEMHLRQPGFTYSAYVFDWNYGKLTLEYRLGLRVFLFFTSKT